MKSWLVHKLGGSTREEVLTEAVIRLQNTVSISDILRTEDGKIMYGTRQLTTAEYDILVQQVHSFRKSLLYKVLDLDLKYNCNQQMRKAVNLQQLETAKVTEFVWDIVKSRLARF